MSSVLGRRAAVLLTALVVAVGLLAGFRADPAAAAKHGRVGAYELPNQATCVYSGNALVGITVPRARVGMNPMWARTFKSQYVGIATVLQGWNGSRWVKVKVKPAKKRHAKRKPKPVVVKVGPRHMRLVPARKKAPVLHFGAKDVRPAYRSYRVAMVLTWYRPSNARRDGRVTSVIGRYQQRAATTSSCVRRIVTAPPRPTVRSISAGDAQACALMSDTTVRCWGAGSYGRLGNGSTSNRSRPVAVTGLSGVTSLTVGNAHGCAVLGSAKTTRCWGYNPHGELGDGTTTNRSTPVTVKSLAGPSRIFTGYDTTCATSSGQPLKCWGLNDHGQVGTGTATTTGAKGIKTPTALSGVTSVTSAGSGRYHACAARSSDGVVWCWGINNYGQVGNSTIDSKTIYKPTKISGVTGTSKIAVGLHHTCAIVANGAVKCWGNDSTGQLGDGVTGKTSYKVVSTKSISNVTDISAWNNSTCAVTGGKVYCWGANTYGQLGQGNTTTYSVPKVVPGLSGIAGVALGGRFACAWNAAGAVWCWGDNTYGELGNGTTTSTTSPTPVSVS